MSELVFVYGTLKADCYNHHTLGKGKLVGKGATETKYTMVDLGAFPGVLKDLPTSTIKGEVYKVNNLASLDILEGYPTFYNRTKVNVDTEDKSVSAWMYYLNDQDRYVYTKVIPSGVW